LAGVLPYLGSYGSTKQVAVARYLREFSDGTYRTVNLSTNVVRTIETKIKAVDKAKRDEIDAFFAARSAATTKVDFEFFQYDADVVNAYDPTGVSTVGRHNAIFTEQEMVWTRDGACRWSSSVRTLWLD
jgi:hypothetical protein